MKYRRADHIAWRQIDEELILVDLAAKEMYGFDLAAAALWHAFEQPFDGRELSSAVAQESSGQISPCDIESFLQRLVELHLLVAVEGPHAACGEALEPPSLTAPPQILWQEAVRQAAGTCAFLPGSGPLCNQAPFS